MTHDSSSNRKPLSAGRCQKVTVMIVDDAVEVADGLSQLISDWGFQAAAVNSGEEAILAAQTHAPAIIISDINMPGIDGFGLARHIRRQPWGARVLLIAHSGWVSEKTAKTAVMSGYDYFLPKPANFTRLRNILIEFLNEDRSDPTR